MIKAIAKMANTTTTPDGAQVGCNRTGRRTDADACSLRRTKGGSRSEVLPEALGRSSKQREPPETYTARSYGVCERERERGTMRYIGT